MAKSLFFTFFIFLIAPLFSSDPLTPHSILSNHGFPADILSYDLNHTFDDFSINLGYPCRLTLSPDNYLATYSKKITGKIVDNRIAELDRIRVMAFFKWWGITGIKASDDDLVFEVRMVTAKYPSKNFDESPQCEGKHSSS